MKHLSIGFLLVALLLTMLPIYGYSETFCQRVNRGGFDEYSQLAKLVNKMLVAKGVTYKTSTKEMKNVMNNYCKSNPHKTEDDATSHLNIIADTLAAAEKMK